MDLAFFVVRIGMSKADYDALSETEKAFIRKEYESKIVEDSTHLRNAVMNGVANVLKKKHSRFIELWKKPRHKADKEYNDNARAVIEQMERSGGKSWVDQIYAANNQRRPEHSRLIKEGGDLHG